MPNATDLHLDVTPQTGTPPMTTDTFTFSITRIPFNEDYQPAEGTRMLVSFTEKGEDHSFTTALGSCFAKFGREVAMEAFNRYWCTRQEGLRPTAGYTQDGRRWMEDASAAIAAAGLAPGVLTRDR